MWLAWDKLFFNWQADGDPGKTLWLARHVNPKGGTVAKLDASIHQAHAQAVAIRPGLVQAGAVFNENSQQFVFQLRADGDLARLEHLRNAVFDGILNDGLQGKGRQPQTQQLVRNRDFDIEAVGKARKFNTQIGIDVFDFIFERGVIADALEALAKEGRKVVHEMSSRFRIASNDRRQRIQRIEQEVRIDLRLQQFDFRLRQQSFLLLDFSGQNLIGEKAGNTFSKSTVERGKKFRCRLIKLNCPEYPVFFAAQRNNQAGAQFAVLCYRAAIWNSGAVGVNDFVVGDGIKSVR